MRTALLSAALLLGASSLVHAQERDRPGDPPGLRDPTARDTLRFGDPRERPAPPPSAIRRGPTVPDAALLIDEPIDRETYVVGPGDLLAVSVFGALDLLYELPVTPEGTLVIPTVGVIPLLGLTLEEAEALVRNRFLDFYRNIDVSLTLSQFRTFKVFVVGDVPEPGPRVASSVTRVSELVPDSAGLARRNVVLQRAGGDTLRVDLTRFRHTGDIRFNPRVREGDTILIPGIDRTVEVYGRVFFPGTYEYRPGETLAELIEVANGYQDFPIDAHDVVQVSRFTSQNEREFLAFSRSEALGAEGAAFALEPFDAIYVPGIGNYKVQKTATIEGEVMHPGTYPIRPDTTRVLDLIEMAGGFTTEASLVSARLRRSPAEIEEEGPRQLEQVPLEAMTEVERQIYRIRQQGDERNVVIDFEGLLGAGEDVYNLTLRDRDSLFVPERREGVTVLGAVLTPGIVAYAPGRNIEEYVELAGGYSERADRGDVVVLKAKLETQLGRDDVRAVEPGDTIVVPFEEEKDWLAIFNTTSGVIGSILGIVLAYLAATR
ncbi:MAG TPA: SLBB domain-containing protein [Gemmatimonadota bacterium]|nr:SLBB domain-containing protein [Gemmatimonadota bacterium]